ncbi:MAG: hypothetical protein EOO68_16755, partial [Moraxellaceae bacterium]
MHQRLPTQLMSWTLAVLCWLAASYCNAEDLTSTATNSDVVGIAINEDMLQDYELFVANRDLASIQHYSGKGSRRDVIDLVLLRQALILGGFSHPIELQPGKSYSRTTRDIVDGAYVTSANQVWLDDIAMHSNDLYISQPLVKSGEFLVGVYTTKQNTKALAARNLEQITELRAVTSSQWTADVRSLKQLGFKQILYSPNWLNMVRMINAGRADITLAPFQQTSEMVIEVNGVELVPIEGVKVSIAGTRHWGISRKHPFGKSFYEALERGMAQLQERGTIQRAYRECGFYHPEIANWTLLAPPASAVPVMATSATTSSKATE